MNSTIRKLASALAILIVTVIFLNSVFQFSYMIFRGFDTLGEALILVSAVVTTMLVFGRGKVNLGGDDDE